MQLNLPIMSTHSPPLRHGELAHSSISVSQSRPVRMKINKKKKAQKQKLKALIIASGEKKQPRSKKKILKLFNKIFSSTQNMCVKMSLKFKLKLKTSC